METLAIKLRPKTLDDVIGQTHIIGKNKMLTNLVKNKHLISMILYGNPGIGKTSIAFALVNDLDVKYRVLNATINNKKDFDTVVAEAKMNNGMVLIMDEIHRLNKDKQDLLLPHVESGLITLIGMTTANPFHSINPAIRSRCQLIELKSLTYVEIEEALKKACDFLEDVNIDDDSIKTIAKLSSGDLRSAYSLLEVCYYISDKNITLDTVKSVNSRPVHFEDKNGDNYYNILSGFQKSIRGSDVDAALHYLARLIVADDFDSIFRRMTVIAYEDIGLANPSMGPKVMAAINACERLGMPEAKIILSNIVIELALSPKSNSAYLAIDKALKDIEDGDIGDMPSYLKDPFIGYKYPHDYKKYWVKQEYMPKNLIGHKYYSPKNNKYEQGLKNYNDLIKKDS